MGSRDRRRCVYIAGGTGGPGHWYMCCIYTLFLCRMLGAGDIKLMALCTGLLGMGPGLLVIFTGLFLAALRAAGMIWQQGSLWMRMERIGTFIIRSGREGKLLEYPGREDKRNILRLGPWAVPGILYMAGWKISLRR